MTRPLATDLATIVASAIAHNQGLDGFNSAAHVVAAVSNYDAMVEAMVLASIDEPVTLDDSEPMGETVIGWAFELLVDRRMAYADVVDVVGHNAAFDALMDAMDHGYDVVLPADEMALNDAE